MQIGAHFRALFCENRNVFLCVFALSLLAQPSVTLAASSQEYDKLLEQADKELNQPQSDKSPAKAKSTVKKKAKKAPVADEESLESGLDESGSAADAGDLGGSAPQTTLKKIQPIPEKAPQVAIRATNDAELANLFHVESTARKSTYNGEPRIEVNAGYRVFQMGRGYTIEKDDDQFAIEAGTMTGVGFEVSPRWTMLQPSSSLHIPFALTLNGGYVSGSLTAQRAGVYSGEEDFDYSIANFDLTAGSGIEMTAIRTDLLVEYGFTSQLLSQRGAEETETASALFYGPLLAAKVSLHLYDPLIVYGRLERFGNPFNSAMSGISGSQWEAGAGYYF